MAINAISNSFGNVGLASPVQMIRNLKFIALPAIALAGSYFTPTAQACNFNECWENCSAHLDAHPIIILMCQAACVFFCKE
jgi:hypothetical protein